MDDTHLKILQMIQDGIISAEEAEELLRAMDSDDPPAFEPELAAESQEPLIATPGTAHRGPPVWWENTWPYLLAAGAVMAALGTAFTIPIAQGSSHPGWLACTLPLAIFGALVGGVTWWSRTARWLHVRVSGDDERVNISLPLPLRLAAWVFRLARPWVPRLRETAVDEVILSLADLEDGGQEMLVVDVDDAETGEQVEVRIG